jgi:drug/metabolite transporter (DMT)-like permease
MATSFIAHDDPKRGILFMLAAVFLFAILNVCIKYLSDHINVFQITFFRCFFSLVPIFFVVLARQGLSGFKTKRIGGHLFRGLTGSLSMLSFFYSFQLLPMADAVVLNFTGPLFLTVLSVLFLKELVDRLEWSALIVGFIGILVIVRPWEGGENVGLFGFAVGLFNAFFYALSMLGVRSLGKTESPVTTVFYFMLITSVLTALPMPWIWQAPSWADFVLLAASGIFGGMAQIFMTRAFQYAAPGVISPYGYSSIIWAMIFGFVLWGEVPAWSVYLGSAIIIGASLVVYYHKGLISKVEPATVPPSAGMEPDRPEQTEPTSRPE